MSRRNALYLFEEITPNASCIKQTLILTHTFLCIAINNVIKREKENASKRNLVLRVCFSLLKSPNHWE